MRVKVLRGAIFPDRKSHAVGDVISITPDTVAKRWCARGYAEPVTETPDLGAAAGAGEADAARAAAPSGAQGTTGDGTDTNQPPPPGAPAPPPAGAGSPPGGNPPPPPPAGKPAAANQRKS